MASVFTSFCEFISGPEFEVPKATTMKMAQNLTTKIRKVSLHAFE